MFSVADLRHTSDLVAAAWMSAADRDWTVAAGTLEWSCISTADHAVDCVYAPAFFLASRRTDAYPQAGSDLMLGDSATPAALVESLEIATRLLAGVVNDTEPDVQSVIFQRPLTVARREDFAPRGALELILHAHDVCTGLGIDFEPPAAICERLREHTCDWPVWGTAWNPLAASNDPWGDLLNASGRRPLTTR